MPLWIPLWIVGIDVLVKRVMCPCRCVVLCSVMEGVYASLSNWRQFVSFDFFFCFLAAKEAIRFHFCFGYFVEEFPFCRRQALHIMCCICA